MSRPFRKWPATAASLAWCIAFLGLAPGCCCLGGGMPAPGAVTLGGVVEEGWQKIRDAGYRAEIREMEQRGGPEASRRLLELAREPKASYKITIEAIGAVGRLGRREDVPGLLRYSGWNRDGVPSGLPWTTDALADIGGPEACAALTELFRERLPRLGRRQHPSEVNIGHLAAAIARAECLAPKDLRPVLWTYGRDLWLIRSLQEGALQFLAERGDAEAARRIAEYAAVAEVRDIQHEALEAIVLRPDLPWWLRSYRMRTYVAADLPRERLFDTLFGMLPAVYELNPPYPERPWGDFLGWIDRIVRFGWTPHVADDPAAYFARKRQEYREALPGPVYARVARWLDYAEGKLAYREALRRRDAGEALPVPNVPELPQW